MEEEFEWVGVDAIFHMFRLLSKHQNENENKASSVLGGSGEKVRDCICIQVLSLCVSLPQLPSMVCGPGADVKPAEQCP